MSTTDLAEEGQQVTLETRIPNLNTQFFFHSTLKKTEFSTHLLAEEVQDHPTGLPPVYSFVKQNVYKNQPEYLNAQSYYNKLKKYCEAPLSKADVIKLKALYHYDEPENNYYELVVMFDYGESDRIDVEQVQVHQITKFLKNVCLLLQDLKNRTDLYHGNIALKNIVLFHDELKISGFKPVFLMNPEYQNWKTDLVKQTSHYRLDIYMIGLIWLRFLGYKPEEGNGPQLKTIAELSAKVHEFYEGLPEDKKTNIVEKFLDVEGNPGLSLEDAVMLFDEYFVIEESKFRERTSQEQSTVNKEAWGRDSIGDPKASLFKSDASGGNQGDNLFGKNVNESGIDGVSFKNENFAHQQENNFSIGDDHTFVAPDPRFQTNNGADESLIVINPDNKTRNSLGGVDNQILQNSDRFLKNSETRINTEKLNVVENRGSQNQIEISNIPEVNSSHQHHSTQKKESNIPEKNSEKGSVVKADGNKSIKDNQRSMTESQKGLEDLDVEPTKKPSTVSLQNNTRTNSDDKLRNKSPSLAVLSQNPSADQMQSQKKSNDKSIRSSQEDIDKKKSDLNSNIDDIAKKSSLIDIQHHKISEPVHEDSGLGVPKMSRPKKSTFKKNPKEGLNARQKIDQMNEKLKERDLPLNYYDYDRNINLARKKVLMEEVNKTDLSDEQREKIRQQVEIEKKSKLEKIAKEEKEKNKFVSSRHEDRLKEAEDLKAKINQLAEKKTIEKKTVEPKDFQEQNYKSQPKPQILPVDQNKITVEGLPVTSEDYKTRKYKSNKHPTVKFMTPTEKDEIFTFNHPLQNKNITFKKVANNPEQYMKNDRSPSPMNTTNNFCELKQNVLGRHLDRTVTSGYNSAEKAGAGLPQTTSHDLEEIKENSGQVLNSKEVLAPKQYPDGFQFDNFNYPVWKDIAGLISQESRGQQVSNSDQVLKEAATSKNIDPAFNFYEENKDKMLLSTKLKFLKNLTNVASELQDPQSVKKCLIEVYALLSEDSSIANQPKILQTLALTVAEIELSADSGETALAILKSKDFEPEIFQPFRYDQDYAHACKLTKREGELADYLIKRIEDNKNDSFRHLDIRHVFVNIARVLEIANSSGDIKLLVKFCTKIQKLLEKIKRVNEGLDLKEHDYENLIECHFLNSLRFAKRVGNYNLSNFLIGENIKHKQTDFVKNMNEDERKELINLILDFCGHLKKYEDYAGYKDNYIKYLNYAKEISKQCDLKPDNLKTSLVIDFNRAIYLMKEEDYPQSEHIFDQCLTTYVSFFKEEADQDLFSVFYDLGKALKKKYKNKEACFFFYRVLFGKCNLEKLREKSRKRLGECHFLLEEYGKAKDIFLPYILDHLQDRSPQRYYRYLCEYFISCQQTNPEDFNHFFKRISDLENEDIDSQLYLYSKTFKTLQSIKETHHEYKENHKLIDVFKDVVSDKRKNKETLPRLFNVAAALHNELLIKNPSKADSVIQKLADLVYDDFSTIEENVINLQRFIDNVFQLFLRLTPLYNERENSQQARQELVRKIRDKYSEPEIRENLYDVIRELSKKRTGLSDNYFTQDSSNERNRLPSEQLLTNPTIESNDHVLNEEFGGNKKLRDLVVEFLKQIKNLLFLDIIENVLSYYLKFEQTLVDLGLNYQKYNFIKQLIRFHLSRPQGFEINKTTFVSLLDGLFGKENICRRDLSLLIILLEAFKDINYLRLLVIYLDQYHPNTATIVIKELFFEKFMVKSERITQQFFDQMFDYKFHELENCYFMHHLESQNFLKIHKNFNFKLFLRGRHDLLSESGFRSLFSKYVPSTDLVYFDLKYHLYSAVIKQLKGDKQEFKVIFANFQRGFMEALTRLDSDRNKLFNLVYELLIIAENLRLPQHSDGPAVLLHVLEYIIEKFNFSLHFQISRVLSLLGNVFFKWAKFEECLHAKKLAMTLMNEDSKVNLIEPPYMPLVTKEQHYFHILSFQLMSNHHLNRLEIVQSILDKQNKWNSNDLGVSMHKKVLQALVDLSLKKHDTAVSHVYSAIDIFSKMELTPFLNRIHQAILDKITLMVIEASNKKQSEVEIIRRKSKLSIGKLYE